MIEGVNQRQALVEESLRFGAFGCNSVVVVAQAWQNRCRSRRSAHLMLLGCDKGGGH
jgi:hypothetical protein